MLRKLQQPPFILPSLMAAIAAFWASPVRADYAVLRSGLRLHITGYEVSGDRARLTVDGGVVDVAADELVSVEPEDTFRALPQAPPGAHSPGRY